MFVILGILVISSFHISQARSALVSLEDGELHI